jgi:hypothetical protein
VRESRFTTTQPRCLKINSLHDTGRPVHGCEDGFILISARHAHVTNLAKRPFHSKTIPINSFKKLKLYPMKIVGFLPACFQQTEKKAGLGGPPEPAGGTLMVTGSHQEGSGKTELSHWRK